jgi:hypothetical protein
LPGFSIALDDGIDHFPALHAALRGKLRLADVAEYIQAEVLHHESAASGADRFMLDRRRNCVIPDLLSARFFLRCGCHDYLHRLFV